MLAPKRLLRKAWQAMESQGLFLHTDSKPVPPNTPKPLPIYDGRNIGYSAYELEEFNNVRHSVRNSCAPILTLLFLGPHFVPGRRGNERRRRLGALPFPSGFLPLL